MIKAAFILAASASALGLATLSLAQESTDEQFMPVPGQAQENWFLQRASCMLAHNVNGVSRDVIRLQIGMGVSLEVMGERPRVRNNDTTPIRLLVDGAAEESYGIGLEWEGDGRSGYRISVSDELLDRMSAGRRLEIRTGERSLRAIDLAGAGPAIAAMRACHEEAATAMPDDANMSAMDMDMNLTNAMEAQADAIERREHVREFERPQRDVAGRKGRETVDIGQSLCPY